MEYKSRTINSSYTVFKDLNDIKDIIEIFSGESYVVAYLDYKVLIGKLSEKKIFFFNNENIDLKYLIKIRLFNQDKELFCWRKNNLFDGRLRIDMKGSEIDVIDASQILVGTKSKILDNQYSLLSEDRGRELIIPTIIKKNRASLITRNYIGYTNNMLATFIDCRFLDFIEME